MKTENSPEAAQKIPRKQRFRGEEASLTSCLIQLVRFAEQHIADGKQDYQSAHGDAFVLQLLAEIMDGGSGGELADDGNQGGAQEGRCPSGRSIRHCAPAG